MAKAPKNELNIKAAIAALVVAANVGIVDKLATNIRLKHKTWNYVLNGTKGNLASINEDMFFWLLIPTKPEKDFSSFETSINEATNSAFNGLQIINVYEGEKDGNWYRYYEIKVN